ncbi:hypothetical protein B0A55_11201 [Friedmanniomyces simplex]|uniref:Uncharacterized protein n=1 Tax=Friedmanniomyces simplex TaxID=329884 RepID=A0A4U0WI54_9PEZI|nr:hypothetical protein B0A55_11201 [Friedmanniomyces simplex]
MAANPFADALAVLEQFKDTWSPTTTNAKPTCGACDSPTQASGAALMMCKRCKDKYTAAESARLATGRTTRAHADEIHVPIQEIPRYAYDSPRWVDPPATQALGLPLRLIANPLGDHSLRNKQAETLGLIPFPDNAKLGETLFPSSAAGAVTVVRADREKLHGFQMAAMISYLMYCGKEVRDAKEREQEKGEGLDRKAMARTLFVPAAFVEAFRALKEYHLAPDGDEVVGRIWREVECPVRIDSV